MTDTQPPPTIVNDRQSADVQVFAREVERADYNHDPEAQVGALLERARTYTAEALARDDRLALRDARVGAAMLVEMARTHQVSIGLRLDATEMERRAERALGLSVRRGQKDGTVETPAEARMRGSLTPSKSGLRNKVTQTKPRPLDFARPQVWSSSGGIYAVTDGVSDEMHDQALSAARAEGKLTRANVGRKVSTLKAGVERTPVASEARRQRITTMAAEGYSTRQIASSLGITEETVGDIARRHTITIAADQAVKRSRRVDGLDVARRTVQAVEDALAALELAEVHGLTEVEAGVLSDSLRASLSKLRQLNNRLRKVAKR